MGDLFGDKSIFSNNPFDDDGFETLANAPEPPTEPDEDVPVFKVERVNYQPNKLKQLIINNNLVAIAQKGNTISRIHLLRSETIDEIELPRRDDSINKMFLDPSGKHLLVTTEMKDNYYLNGNSSKLKPLLKMKGIEVTSVGWDVTCNSDNCTNEIIFGTVDGKIYSVVIDNSFDRNVSKDIPPKLLFTLDVPMAISGLYWERFPGSSTSFFVLITTQNRIYQFVGERSLELLFGSYDAYSEFQEIPEGRMTHSELSVFRSPVTNIPKRFSWLTGPGIFHGSISFDEIIDGSKGNKVLADAELLYYNAPELASDNPADENILPVSLALSEYHFLILYPSRMIGINTISKQSVFEYTFPASSGRLISISRDTRIGTIMIGTEQAVFELSIQREDADVWSLYLERKEWEIAAKMCKGDQQKLNTVYITQGEGFFEQKQYEKAAVCFAKTVLIIDHVVLRFYFEKERQMEAIILYLNHKLDHIDSKYQTQLECLCVWLAEIYMGKIARAVKDNNLIEVETLRDDFFEFIKKYRLSIEPHTMFSLLWSHGLTTEMLRYAEAIGNFKQILVHFIQLEQYENAVDVLSRLPREQEELFYRFSPLLLLLCTDKLVFCWMKTTYLKPKKLFPSFIRYELQKKEDTENPITKYLEFVVRKGNKDVVIHNYLLSLLARTCKDDEKLIKFIKNPQSCYDSNYGLRVCNSFDRQRACVVLYTILKLYEEAVDLALKVDISLAIEAAESPALLDDENMRKKIWLKIAQHVVKEKKDIKSAMEFLTRSDLLKLEDVLPFFPDFTVIDGVRDEVLKELIGLQKRIETEKRTMDSSTVTASRIRRDTVSTKDRSGFIDPNVRCGECKGLLLTSPFFYFPCAHCIHISCLTDLKLRQANNSVRIERIKRLASSLRIELKSQSFVKQKEERPSETILGALSLPFATLQNISSQGVLPTQIAPHSATESVAPTLKPEEEDALWGDLERIIGEECPFCGMTVWNSVAERFVSGSEDEKRQSDWNIEEFE